MFSLRINSRLAPSLGAVILFLSATMAFGATPTIQRLWTDAAPGAIGDKEGDIPTLTVYLPPSDRATGAAIVICPGGGYGHLAMDHEGHQVAQWLNSFGVAGFILTYRHRGTGYGHPAPMQDAQRAVRMVRSRAKDRGIDPARIGIMGFSAGGHLASTVGTHFDVGRSDVEDPIERISCRPDFMILVYPVISFVEPFTHAGSRKNLLGPEPDEAMIERFSNERQVSSETPPTFLVHGTDDKGVPVENSVHFYMALRKANVSAEMHLYVHGPHGFGLGKPGEAAAAWPAQCEAWLRGLGIAKPK